MVEGIPLELAFQKTRYTRPEAVAGIELSTLALIVLLVWTPVTVKLGLG